MFFKVVVVSIASCLGFSAWADEGFYRPGDLATAFSQTQVGKAVWTLKTPGGEKGTLFFVSPDGHFFTSLHLIEYQLGHLTLTGKLSLGNGHSGKPLRIQGAGLKLSNNLLGTTLNFTEFEVVSLPAQSWSWAVSPNLGYKRDFVLCRVDFKPEHWLTLSKTPARKGDTVYAFAYPDHMMRLSASIRDGRYEDADGTLRVSKGLVRSSASYLWSDRFLSDADAYKGSSGAPTVNEKGEVVGLLYGPVTPAKFQDVSYYKSSRVGHVHALELVRQLDLADVEASCARHLASGT